jgi:hypothetical protein
MGSVGELAEAIQQANSASDEYLALQRPTAEMLAKLAIKQQAIGMVLGDLLSQLTQCNQELDEHVAHQLVAAKKLDEASFGLDIAANGTNDPDLQGATVALSAVSSETEDFGGLLVTMGTTVSGQVNFVTQMVEQLGQATLATDSMASQASEHVLRVGEASMALQMYTDNIT